MKIRNIIFFVFILFIVLNAPIYSEQGEPVEDSIQNEFHKLLDEFVYFREEGYYPNCNIYELSYTRLIDVDDKVSFAVQPLIFLRVESVENGNIFYTRNFNFQVGPDNFLMVGDSYKLLPHIQIFGEWDIIQPDYELWIRNGKQTHRLSFFMPTPASKIVSVDPFIYQFSDVVEVSFYNAELGKKEIPSFYRDTVLLFDFERMLLQFKKLQGGAETEKLIKWFMSSLESQSSRNYSFFYENLTEIIEFVMKKRYSKIQ